MRNLRVTVNNAADQTEARNIMISLGYLPKEITCISGGDLGFVVNAHNENGATYKEITLPQLRDMVVLKRNSIDDATHKGSITDNVYYVSSDEEVYRFESSAWCFSTVIVADLKPIEKTEMKEYLRKNSNGTYSYIGTVRPEHVSDFMIEIPKTAELVLRNKQGKIEFFKDKCGSKFENGNWIGVSIPFARLQEGRILFLKGGCQAYWDSDFSKTLAAPFNLIESRHTHPEELPFIDDDFKLNIPEELKGRADLLSGRIIIDDECYTNKSDGVFRLPISEPCDISNWVEIREEGSLNDQYAEIEGVRQTLKTRQEQYGSFEDVAMITEQMVDVMRKGYYEKLSYNQKMALYMICSKMARIVNGNPNHKDSWHDISGYATLIDNELVSEKDMPF